jgi:glycosyltransferase involved in cell wall biosynthesis
MHVLMLPSWYSTPDRPLAGGFFQDQAHALARFGARVGVAYVEDRGLRTVSPAAVAEAHFQTESTESDGVTTLRMKGWNTFRQTTPGARIWCALTRGLVHEYAARFGKPDVIHAHCALWAGRAAVASAADLGRPSVITEHFSVMLNGQLSRERRSIAAAAYQRADAVLAVSDALLGSVRSIGARNGRVVPNAVDTEFFTLPRQERPRETFTFLAVGNLVASKRFDLLVRAFAAAFAGDSRMRLVIVGAGPQEQNLRSLIAQTGTVEQVELTGALRREAVREQMWRANALVLPSAFETFGVVLVEALATGIPVISTRCGGPEEIVSDAVGCLIDTDDEAGLQTALVQTGSRVYDQRKLRNYAVERYSYDAVARQLTEVYAGVGGSRV